MKKNFFKKLSFVMALAMIVSIVAPAAGAFAADDDDPHLNATKKYLHLSATTGYNEYDFNIAHKLKGWQYAWTSADEDVATVSSSGLTTATGVGSTKVSVQITDKDGEDVATLSADVVVRDNIKTVAIANAPTKALAVNEEYDFNRNFVTVSGATQATGKTSSVTRWVVDKADTATVSASGLFKATAAGEYKVTALAFQSTAKYEEWLVSKAETLVLATSDAATVTVVPGVVSTKQINSTKFEVTFDTDMSATDIKTASAVYQIIGGKKVSSGTEKIKEIKLDTTGKIATVEMYAALNSKVVYNFEYKDLVATFTAAATDLTDIAGLVFDDFKVDVEAGTGADMLDSINAVNKDGVVIKSGDDIASYLEFTYNGDLNKGFTSSNMAYIYDEGYSATVTAKFTNYVYNETTQKYDTVTFSDAATALGAKTNKDVNTATMQYFVDKLPGTPAADKAWSGSVTVPANDGAFTIHTRYKTNNNANDYVYTDDTATFTYVSNDTDKLLANGNVLVPLAQGTVTVLVYKGTAVAGAFDVVIMASRSFAGLTQDTSSMTVGNNPTYFETGYVNVTAKDSMNEQFAPAVKSIEVSQAPSGADKSLILISNTTDGDGKVTFAVTAANAKEGAYSVKATLSGYNADKDVYFTIIVRKATDADPTNAANKAVKWVVALDKSSVDLKKNTGAVIGVSVYGLNAAGARVDQLTDAEYAINVKLNGSTVDKHVVDGATAATTGTSIGVVAQAASGTALEFYATGSYIVTATVVGASSPTGRVADAVIGYAQFTVSDTTVKSVSVKTSTVKSADYGTVAAAVNAAFGFKLNDADIDTALITKYVVSDGSHQVGEVPATTAVTAGTNLRVESITYTVHNDNGTDTNYTFEVKKTIAIQ
jgi:hypothetical protein